MRHPILLIALLLLSAIPTNAQFFFSHIGNIVRRTETRREQFGLRGPVRRVYDGYRLLEFDRRGNIVWRDVATTDSTSENADDGVRYTYDERDSVITEVRLHRFHGTTDSAVNSYDSLGRRIARREYRQMPYHSWDTAKRTFPLFGIFDYRYDTAGRLAWARVEHRYQLHADTAEYTFSYDSTRIEKGAFRGWGIRTTTVRIPDGWLRELFDTTGARRASIVRSQSVERPMIYDTIWYDRRGNITLFVIMGAEVRMTYDTLGNVITQEAYQYDSFDDYIARRNGSLAKRETITYRYDHHGNWIERRARRTRTAGKNERSSKERITTRRIEYW